MPIEIDRLDAVVDEIDLAAALQLVRIARRDHLLVELDDVGLDRQPILRRRLDDRHVADADERHVQRARDRRRAHRQHVDVLPQLLDLLLVRDAEALLLVDDEQPEIAELHVLRQQAVRADDDVDLAGGEIGERCPSARPCVRNRLTMSMRTGKPANRSLQRLLVLERQDRRRRQERDLLAVHHRFERRAHGHFGLAVADVAAEQPVHRRRRSPCRA